MAEKGVRTYDPKQIIMTFGPIVFSGYAEGTFVTLARSGDAFTKVKGADGGVDRVNNNALDFAVTVTLKQTSLVNDLLSASLNLDLITNLGILPLIVKDLAGTTLFVATSAWIAKDPDLEYGDAQSGREWRFDTGPADLFQGGSLV